MDKPLHELSIAEAGRRLRAGSLTSRALTLDALKRIEAIDPKINAFITVTPERARAIGVDTEYALIPGSLHAVALRARWGARRPVPLLKSGEWLAFVHDEVARFRG